VPKCTQAKCVGLTGDDALLIASIWERIRLPSRSIRLTASFWFPHLLIRNGEQVRAGIDLRGNEGLVGRPSSKEH
jgi:hypothetical protein